MNDKEYELLHRTILFSTLDDNDLRALLDRPGVTECRYAPQQMIDTPNRFTRSIGVLLSGSAAVEKFEGTASMLMSVLRPGDIFGAATILSDVKVYPVSIRALGPSSALLIDEETFLVGMRENFALAENYIRYLTGRIRFLNTRIDGFAQSSSEERLYTFLKCNAVNGVCELGFPVRSLADALCIGRATLYRAFDTLEAQGRVRRNGRTITLIKGE